MEDSRHSIIAGDDPNVPTAEEKTLLKYLVGSSDLDRDEREAAYEIIEACSNYRKYEQIQHRLEARQPNYHEIPNPSMRDINRHLKNFIK